MTISPTTAAANSVAATADSATSSNFNTFLTLLTTQLRNQDPTSPLDTNQFTQQLVQYSQVEQQINTNKSLTTLIDLNRASSLYQASSMVGHHIGVTSSQLSLQNGSAGVAFTLAAAQPVTVTVSNSSGTTLYQASVDAKAGSNGWQWDGTDSRGRKLADGVYTVSVNGGAGAKVALPFTVTGTATAIDASGATPSVKLGALSVPMSAVQSVLN